MPATGTSIENGATTSAGWRLISTVHRPEPTTVAITTMYSNARHARSVRIAVFQSAAQMLLPGLLAAVADDPGVQIECGEEDVAQREFVPLTGEYDIVDPTAATAGVTPVPVPA
jgi:DNA-binding transcriptional LysR family regulator